MEDQSTDYTSFMVPGADLLNFGKSGATIGGYDTTKHAFVITAKQEWKRGDEVTYYYSDECDEYLLFEYGFKSEFSPECSSKKLASLKLEIESERKEEKQNKKLKE